MVPGAGVHDGFERELYQSIEGVMAAIATERFLCWQENRNDI
jgi:hypothetical protein